MRVAGQRDPLEDGQHHRTAASEADAVRTPSTPTPANHAPRSWAVSAVRGQGQCRARTSGNTNIDMATAIITAEVAQATTTKASAFLLRSPSGPPVRRSSAISTTSATGTRA